MGSFAGPYQVDTQLPEEMGSITAARQTAREALDGCGYLGRHDDVVLVVSELITNALVHGDGPPALRIRCTPSHVRIEVRDSGPGLPTPREPGPADGWGLNVIGTLSTGWGVTRGAGDGESGKVVWCELAAQVAPQATPQTTAQATPLAQERSRA
ncbi:ATP-binding protein [Nonomuraea sp. WAC 01424]|uniref:ATP-binding protein n=1 Tax=Nonomuraea sp. WAC 01424 TaxID=2203200 RepID=UPI000F773F74|nr:ATP-binding protein [Nonomuraea sp. WAC 01424]RSN06704.1 ATP-binding protein [Nonomuraea sp. WAC 01424]